MKENENTKEYDFVATVVFVVDGDEFLLAIKKEKIGSGRYNGPGGKVEKWDPSIEFRATLEMWQEIGIVCMDEALQKVAIGRFTNIKGDGSVFVCEVHFFVVEFRDCNGFPAETREMGPPCWFHKKNPPFDFMMPADTKLVSAIFERKKVVVRATMKNHQSELVGEVEMVEVEEFR